MNNYYNPNKIKFVPVATITIQVNAGGAEYRDTDASATMGTDTSRLWLIYAYTSTKNDMGARPHGSTVDSKVNAIYATFLSRVDGSGHIDLYRNAAGNAFYFPIGYFE